MLSLSLTKNSEQLANIYGILNQNLNLIEKQLGVSIYTHGDAVQIEGDNKQQAKQVLTRLIAVAKKQNIDGQMVAHCIQQSRNNIKMASHLTIKLNKKNITISGDNQIAYAKQIDEKDCVFGIGPAGTGKTYLAVAKGVEALMEERVKRLILVRPAVEAGEKLGFLPGDINEKIDPYLQATYDALYEILGHEKTQQFIEKKRVAVAPLAFMRGRTLKESFVILDEAQNCTNTQMKMFLTRLGFGSKMVITGDITQIDLDKSKPSGLIEAIRVLGNEKEIAFCYFDECDVLRHHLVQKIIQAYQL